MTRIKMIVFLGWLMMTGFVVPLAQAQNPTEAPAKIHSTPWIQEIYTQLNLTDDQKKQLEVNKQQHRAMMANIRQQIRMNKEAMKAELMKDQLDMVKIHAIHQRIKLLQDQMEDGRLNSILAVRKILTSEQFVKFVTLMKKHRTSSEKQGN